MEVWMDICSYKQIDEKCRMQIYYIDIRHTLINMQNVDIYMNMYNVHRYIHRCIYTVLGEYLCMQINVYVDGYTYVFRLIDN